MLLAEGKIRPAVPQNKEALKQFVMFALSILQKLPADIIESFFKNPDLSIGANTYYFKWTSNTVIQVNLG